MKEVLYTIPLNDAYNENSECPFCVIERNVEQNILDFVLGPGSSYMESDVRSDTDAEGFCRPHFKKMYEYGNTLGNAWILKTHYKRINSELEHEIARFSEGKPSLLKKSDESRNTMSGWISQREDSCYICKRYNDTYERYIATFYHMYINDSDFRKKLKESKGFCLSHFKDIMDAAPKYLSKNEKTEFYQMMFELMRENMKRLQEDVSWMVEKFDYRNKDADWKNSKDAIQRGMQKLKGGIYD